MNRETSVRILKGVGDKTEYLLRKAGITNLGDLIFFIPKTYDIYGPVVPFRQVEEGTVVAVLGTFTQSPSFYKGNRGIVVSGTFHDGYGAALGVRWFNQPYLKNQIQIGQPYVARGRIMARKGGWMLEQPKLFLYEKYQPLTGFMQPVYAIGKGITSLQMRKFMQEVFHAISLKELNGWSVLPENLEKENALMRFGKALYTLHFPENWDTYREARKRFVFEEFFAYLYGVRQMGRERLQGNNPYPIFPSQESGRVLDSLPFSLTHGQQQVLGEIRRDLSGEHSMNRMLQGDVGSGKTILAFIALLDSAMSGFQGVMMAPTEILARQHYMALIRLLKNSGIQLDVAFLSGGLSAREKRKMQEDIATGKYRIILGTHALFQEGVQYQNLALVVTDEQHRFGVNHRESLVQKGVLGDGERPHVLIMSATPIPRSLAIVLYGDTDLSVLTDKPVNRLPVKTCIIKGSQRATGHRFIQKELDKGHQAYVICQMIEPSESMEGEDVVSYAHNLKKVFSPEVKVDILHGRMSVAEKADVMERFRQNRVQILVATTVVEVGVDVPNATAILIEDAQRFGLASLHQLRGRVGRGDAQAYCILVQTTGNEISKRLEVLYQSNDGFYIAEEDLKLRGPGDLLGVRQSGQMAFALADVYNDADLLLQAEKAVRAFENSDV